MSQPKRKDEAMRFEEDETEDFRRSLLASGGEGGEGPDDDGTEDESGDDSGDDDGEDDSSDD